MQSIQKNALIQSCRLHWAPLKSTRSPTLSNGTVTSTGTTQEVKETLFGTCYFLTNATDIGTLTGKDAATNTSGTATFDIRASIPSENCGFSGSWEGSYVQVNTAAGVLTPFNVSES